MPYSLEERYEKLQEYVVYIFYLSCEKTLYITSKYCYLLNGGTLRHIPQDGNINNLPSDTLATYKSSPSLVKK